MTHGSLFSGIGGFDLAAEWMGWENKFHCEWNEFGQKVLNYYWPNAECFGDITKTDFTKYAHTIDIVSGGFPCQPFSASGKRKGNKDDRHLWPEMLRAIKEIQPRWVVGENVLGLLNWSKGMVFHEVQTDLEAAGYIIFPYVLPACSQNAPHRRDRVWIIAYSSGNGQQRRKQRLQEAQKQRYDAKNMFAVELQSDWERNSLPKPTIFSDDDGLSWKLDGITLSKFRTESIKAYGNAIVPQVAFQIFRTIDQYELLTQK